MSLTSSYIQTRKKEKKKGMKPPSTMSSTLPTLPTLLFLFLVLTISYSVQAQVPASKTFKYINAGGYGDDGGLQMYVVELGAYYRVLNLYSPQGPFVLCFYNTTPNGYTLALRMGSPGSASIMRWVWEANRGNPVGENASLTLGQDGNLVLADSDGRIAWQTHTANKGVAGLKVLDNGNIVLHDKNGKFVWQSFDYPTDTLLVGQSLKLEFTSKLVSRASEVSNGDGPYSLAIEGKDLVLQYRSSKIPKPLVYFSFLGKEIHFKSPLNIVTFQNDPDFSLALSCVDASCGVTFGLRWPKYNASNSFLRLDLDGNLRIYTYLFQIGADGQAWEVTYTFMDEGSWESKCQLPEKCGSFGLCEDNQCVACPLPSGLMGWSKGCQPPKLSSCAVKDFHYYKLEGVDHFMCKYTTGNGPMKYESCRAKCTKDCKCLGYFYNMESYRCWIAYDLKTLSKVSNSTHLAFIKAPNKLG